MMIIIFVGIFLIFGIVGVVIGVHIATEIAFKKACKEACKEASARQLTKVKKNGKEYIVPSYVLLVTKNED